MKKNCMWRHKYHTLALVKSLMISYYIDIHTILHYFLLLHITAKKSIIFGGRCNFYTMNIEVKSFMHLLNISFPEPATFLSP